MRYVIAALTLCIATACACRAWGGPTPGTAANAYSETTTDTQVTVSVTTTGSNRYLLCHAGARSVNITSVSGVTYNGVAMTRATGSAVNFNTSELWGLANPSSGANNAVATFDAQIGASGSASLTCLPVSEASSLGTPAGNDSALGDPVQVVVSSAADQLVVAAVIAECSAALTSGDTSQSSVRTATNLHCYALSTAAGASSVTMDWTNSTATWNAKGIAVTPSSPGAGGKGKTL